LPEIFFEFYLEFELEPNQIIMTLTKMVIGASVAGKLTSRLFNKFFKFCAKRSVYVKFLSETNLN